VFSFVYKFENPNLFMHTPKSPVINTLKEWSKTKKIFFEYENNNSYIIKLAN
jgi:hypothetical protein